MQVIYQIWGLTALTIPTSPTHRSMQCGANQQEEIYRCVSAENTLLVNPNKLEKGSAENQAKTKGQRFKGEILRKP